MRRNHNEEKIILQGYDNRCVLHDTGQCVLRKVSPDYFSEIARIYDLYVMHRLDQHGIVTTEIDRSSSSLKHEKHTISYPFEWTANMFKDAVLFHLRLIKELDRYGLTLKDALPSNIVFHKWEPVFVDFTSLVQKDRLGDEEWLVDWSQHTDPRYAVVDRMLLPFMLIPLMAMQKNKYALARRLLSEKACNCGGGLPRWIDLYFDARAALFPVQSLKSMIKRLIVFFSGEAAPYGHVAKLRGMMKRRQGISFADFNNTILEFLADVKVTPEKSAYLSYYENKKENFDFTERTAWNAKQKNVCGLLDSVKPGTVLDLGANTGWFSILAARNRANVIATDIDESSIDSLYLYAKEHRLPVLSLLMSYDDLTRKIYGVECQEPLYRERDFKGIPLFLPATQRLNADMVLCLGLLHHLVLGLGREIGAVMQVLSGLAGKHLVLEFVSINDKLIQAEPSFFKNLRQYSEDNYHIDIAVEEGMRFFKSVEIMDSDSNTRKLLVFSK